MKCFQFLTWNDYSEPAIGSEDAVPPEDDTEGSISVFKRIKSGVTSPLKLKRLADDRWLNLTIYYFVKFLSYWCEIYIKIKSKCENFDNERCNRFYESGKNRTGHFQIFNHPTILQGWGFCGFFLICGFFLGSQCMSLNGHISIKRWLHAILALVWWEWSEIHRVTTQVAGFFFKICPHPWYSKITLSQITNTMLTTLISCQPDF